jgi:hypothetical protein
VVKSTSSQRVRRGNGGRLTQAQRIERTGHFRPLPPRSSTGDTRTHTATARHSATTSEPTTTATTTTTTTASATMSDTVTASTRPKQTPTVRASPSSMRTQSHTSAPSQRLSTTANAVRAQAVTSQRKAHSGSRARVNAAPVAPVLTTRTVMSARTTVTPARVPTRSDDTSTAFTDATSLLTPPPPTRVTAQRGVRDKRALTPAIVDARSTSSKRRKIASVSRTKVAPLFACVALTVANCSASPRRHHSHRRRSRRPQTSHWQRASRCCTPPPPHAMRPRQRASK